MRAPRKYWSAAEDELLRQEWCEQEYGRQCAERAARILGVTPYQVSYRAAALGLTYSKERQPWTDHEITVLERHAEKPLHRIRTILLQAGSPGRSRSAIASQLARLALRSSLDGLTKQDLARALGVGTNTVERWRASGLISASRIEGIRNPNWMCESGQSRPWFFANREIARFLLDHPGEYSLRSVNQAWFIGLLQDYYQLKRRLWKDQAKPVAAAS